jgi:tRNA (guanine6-N2)-methyltransferase
MKRNSQLSTKPVAVYHGEAEVTEGLEFIAEAELKHIGAQVIYQNPAEVGFRFAGYLPTLLDLKTVQAVYLVQQFPVPRPRGLLDNTYFRQLLTQIKEVLDLSGRSAFQSLHLAAAGSDSAVMLRIKQSLARELTLNIGDDKGDLWIRVRPSRVGGWETLIRLSPRPLVTRPWRVCSLEGALNAADAQAMIRLSQPATNDVFVNLGCGSGTLLIERIAFGRHHLCIGLDHNREHLRCAEMNIQASGYHDRIHVEQADMTRIPIASGSVTALCADLPFGQLTGSHQHNQVLYPRVFGEAARIARPGARFVVITPEIKLMEKLLAQNVHWSPEQIVRVNLRGLHPRIYVLRRLTTT